ncbi:MAG TPA: HEAT repeat domain-containing protein, partial [Chthoniobacteraceae bacterium]
LEGAGIVRVRPDGSGLEVFSKGTRNACEAALDAEDHVFTLDDAGGDWGGRLIYHIEGGRYGYPFDFREKLEKGTRRRAVRFLPPIDDFGDIAPTGLIGYSSDGLPDSYIGKLICCDAGLGEISTFEVARDGATFRLVNAAPLVRRGANAQFHPTRVAVAGDGSLLVCDCGPEKPEDAAEGGAIWRVSWPEARPAPRLEDESTLSIPELLAGLRHPDRDQRLRAEYALIAKNDDPVEALLALLEDANTPTLQKMHVIWALEGIMGPVVAGATYKGPATLGLRHRDKFWEIVDPITRDLANAAAVNQPNIQAQIIRALAYRRTWLDCEGVGKLAGEMQASPDPTVRCQAASAMGRMSYLDLPQLLLKLLEDPDQWVRASAQYGLQKEFIEHGLMDLDSENKYLTRPELSDAVWQIFETFPLGRRINVSPTFRLDETQAWNLQEETVSYVAGRLKGNFRASAADRAEAAKVLGQWAFRLKGYAEALSPERRKPSDAVSWAATKPCVAALNAALSDSTPLVRLAAARALALGSSHDVTSALRRALEREADPEVKAQLAADLEAQSKENPSPEAVTGNSKPQ